MGIAVLSRQVRRYLFTLFAFHTGEFFSTVYIKSFMTLSVWVTKLFSEVHHHRAVIHGPCFL